jgi:hypothetical protein
VASIGNASELNTGALSAVVSTAATTTTAAKYMQNNFSDECKFSPTIHAHINTLSNHNREIVQDKETTPHSYVENTLSGTAQTSASSATTTYDKQRYSSNYNSSAKAEPNRSSVFANTNSRNNNSSGLLVDIGLFADLEANTQSHSQISPAYSQHHRLIDKNTNRILNHSSAPNSASTTANTLNPISAEPGGTFKLRSKFTNSRLLINFDDETDSQMINQNYIPSENNNLNSSINSYDSIVATPAHVINPSGRDPSDSTQRSNQYTTALDDNLNDNHLNSTSSSVSDHCHVLKNNSLLDKRRNANVWRKLILVLILCVLFMIGEIVGGIIAHSISIQTDAAHMAADIAGFFLSIVAIYMSGKGIWLFNLLIKKINK